MTYSKKYIIKAIKKSRRMNPEVKARRARLKQVRESRMAAHKAYQVMIKDIDDTYQELSKISKPAAESFIKEINSKKKSFMSSPLVAKQIASERNKKITNAPKRIAAENNLRVGLASTTRKAMYNPSNLKNYQTFTAAKRAGLKVSKSRAGNLKVDLQNASKEQKSKYKNARRSFRENSTSVLIVMGAYEEKYGINGHVADSNQVMSNITTFLSENNYNVSGHYKNVDDEILAAIHSM